MNAVKVLGKIRDITVINGEAVIIIAAPRIGHTVVKEHACLRERDVLDRCETIGKPAIGREVIITGELGSYVHHGVVKACLRNVSKFKCI